MQKNSHLTVSSSQISFGYLCLSVTVSLTHSSHILLFIADVYIYGFIFICTWFLLHIAYRTQSTSLRHVLIIESWCYFLNYIVNVLLCGLLSKWRHCHAPLSLEQVCISTCLHTVLIFALFTVTLKDFNEKHHLMCKQLQKIYKGLQYVFVTTSNLIKVLFIKLKVNFK